MISDTLFQAIEDIEQYQKMSPTDYDKFKGDIELVKAVMASLQERFDQQTPGNQPHSYPAMLTEDQRVLYRTTCEAQIASWVKRLEMLEPVLPGDLLKRLDTAMQRRNELAMVSGEANVQQDLFREICNQMNSDGMSTAADAFHDLLEDAYDDASALLAPICDRSKYWLEQIARAILGLDDSADGDLDALLLGLKGRRATNEPAAVTGEGSLSEADEEFLKELEAMEDEPVAEMRSRITLRQPEEPKFPEFVPDQTDMKQLAESYLEEAIDLHCHTFFTGCWISQAHRSEERFERVVRHLGEAKRRQIIDECDRRNEQMQGDQWHVFKNWCGPGFWSKPASCEAMQRVAASVPDNMTPEQQEPYGGEYLDAIREIKAQQSNRIRSDDSQL